MEESPEVKINQLVKTLNQRTERDMTAQEVHELQALIAKIGARGQGAGADRAALQKLREAPCDLEKRRMAVAALNQGHLGTHWRFRVHNGRIISEKRPVPTPGAMDVLVL